MDSIQIINNLGAINKSFQKVINTFGAEFIQRQLYKIINNDICNDSVLNRSIASYAEQVLQFYSNTFFSRGNKKIGKDTIIFNFSSAERCESDKLGLCKLSAVCYAKKAERIYPQVKPFRDRQNTLYVNLAPSEFIHVLVNTYKKAIKNKEIKYLRFSEAGDFINQINVIWASNVAELLKEYNIKVYTYTARKDLNFTNISSNLVVNFSNYETNEHNSFIAIKDTASIKVDKVNKICRADCSLCKLCKVNKSFNIYVAIH